MNFTQCPICHLELPINYMIPIIIVHQGKRVKVMICERCKQNKENEARRNNETN